MATAKEIRRKHKNNYCWGKWIKRLLIKTRVQNNAHPKEFSDTKEETEKDTK